MIAMGAARRRAGQRAAARQPLTEALDVAARGGARPLIAQARLAVPAVDVRLDRPADLDATVFARPTTHRASTERSG